MRVAAPLYRRASANFSSLLRALLPVLAAAASRAPAWFSIHYRCCVRFAWAVRSGRGLNALVGLHVVASTHGKRQGRLAVVPFGLNRVTRQRACAAWTRRGSLPVAASSRS